MDVGGWAAAARHAGAETLFTGRERSYDESTLRRSADRLDQEGCTERVAHEVRAQVEAVIEAQGEPVVAYTDMLDQPSYTKKLAHAAPIGRLGNRLLASTYFGVTTVALPAGPTLFMHLSWHKPASPLRDAMEDLLSDPTRVRWWHRHVRLHILDRGANGDPVLSWLWAWEIPYLTIGHKSAQLWRFRAPTSRNDEGQPLVIRADSRLDGTLDDGPWEVIVPASSKDPATTRGLRFRAGVLITAEELADVNAQYMTRWPSLENRTRRVHMTRSRGVDGELARLSAREASERTALHDLLKEPPSPQNVKAVVKGAVTVKKLQARQAQTEREATLKNARVQGGSEWLGKWLHILTHNALTLALWTSEDETVRTTSPTMLFDLLLGRPALTSVRAGALTMWVERLPNAEDGRRQDDLAEVVNKLRLQCRGRTVAIRMRQAARLKAA
jgi:hypothetical protein